MRPGGGGGGGADAPAGGGGGGGGTPAPRPAPPSTTPVATPLAPTPESPPPVAATPAPAATSPPPGSGRPQPPPTLGDTTREVVGAVGTEVGRISPPVGQVVEDAGDTLGDTVDALNPPAPLITRAQPAQRVALQLGVVLNGAVMAARARRRARCAGRASAAPARASARPGPARRPRRAGAAAGPSRRSTAASSGCSARNASTRGHVGGEVELAAAQAAPQAVRARGADRDDGARAERARRRGSRGSRPCSIRARRAGRRRAGAAIVATSCERPAVELAAGRAVAALVEADRRQPRRAGRARVVVVALLAGPGAVQDHHAGPRIALRQPQRVGQPVELAELGRGSGGLIAHNRRASWPPRR